MVLGFQRNTFTLIYITESNEINLDMNITRIENSKHNLCHCFASKCCHEKGRLLDDQLNHNILCGIKVLIFLQNRISSPNSVFLSFYTAYGTSVIQYQYLISCL